MSTIHVKTKTKQRLDKTLIIEMLEKSSGISDVKKLLETESGSEYTSELIIVFDLEFLAGET
ncbi:hypothetical protein UFOVP244_137 [uncultured Caudovirales phage]|uniref:Uncharacterized protein n=1 Tax=uncultured Caudovirales phage TaxID=2100421 RepID=A0A6J7WTB3_9CAUD|nr:hypothetical protein UFOVP244_137 [uncultured Caudovirales phage]